MLCRKGVRTIALKQARRIKLTFNLVIPKGGYAPTALHVPVRVRRAIDDGKRVAEVTRAPKVRVVSVHEMMETLRRLKAVS